MAKRWWRRAAQPRSDAELVAEMAAIEARALAEQTGHDTVRPDLRAWAQVVDVSRLSAKNVRWADDYLRRYRRMILSSSQEEAQRLIAVIENQVSPPPPFGVHPLDIIRTVVVRSKELGIV